MMRISSCFKWISVVSFVFLVSILNDDSRRALGQKSTQTRKKLIIDLDGSVEDGRGLLMALSEPSVEVVAIICTGSYLSTGQCAKNMDRIRRLADKPKVPIYKGAREAIIAHKRDNFEMNQGKDGFGDRSTIEPAMLTNMKAEDEPGSLALSRLAKEYKDQIILVVTGPLTTVALALRMDPKLGGNLKAMYVLGGNMFGVGVANGNTGAEYNFNADPEAAYVVVKDLKAPIVLIPHEVVYQRDNSEVYDLFNAPLKKDAYMHKNGTKASFLRSISRPMMKSFEKSRHGFTFGEEIAVAAALRPAAVINRVKAITASVELAGEYTRGQLAIDWVNNKKKTRKNIQMVTDYSSRILSGMMIKMVSDPSEILADSSSRVLPF